VATVFLSFLYPQLYILNAQLARGGASASLLVLWQRQTMPALREIPNPTKKSKPSMLLGRFYVLFSNSL
jgi:hypothetical protein